MASCKYVSGGYQLAPGEKLFSMGETCVPDRPIIVCPSEGGSMPPEWEAGCGITPIGTDPGEVTALVKRDVQAIVPLPPAGSGGILLPPSRGGGLDVTGQDPFDPYWDQFAPREEVMGGFLPGRFPGAPRTPTDWTSWIPDVLDDFLPQRPPIPGGGTGPTPGPSVDIPGLPVPIPVGPFPGGQVLQGRVVMDACGRCFIERTLPARVVRRRGRIVMGPNGVAACLPAPRRMNALNPRALSRALRRAQKFAKFAKQAVRISTGLKMKRGFKAPRKRKPACCPK